MKIAVTDENGRVFQHFGHCESFRIYTAEEKKILSSETVRPQGGGHGALAEFLRGQGVDTLICGGIGGGAREALGKAGIALYPGVQGSADEAVKALLEGSLVFDPDTVCAHHHHGNDCGEEKHGCPGQ